MAEESPKEFQIVLCRSEDGQVKVDVVLHGDSVWLILNQMPELFARDKSVTSRPELEQAAVVVDFAATAPDGTTRSTCGG